MSDKKQARHNMKTGKMFHDLLLYEKEEFYVSHKTIVFDTMYGVVAKRIDESVTKQE